MPGDRPRSAWEDSSKPPTLTGPGRKVKFEVSREVTLNSKTDKDEDNIVVEAIIHEITDSN